ncbi:MAG: DNA polymerase domain-containing protein [Acidobacteriota bacterium]
MKISGWILDLYPSPAGMTLWLIQPNQKRLRLIDPSFHPRFYVQGAEPRLRQLSRVLAARGRVHCAITEKMNIWEGHPIPVLEVTVHHPAQFPALARFVRRYDTRFTLYNSDLMLAPLYCWEKNVFPLARVDIETARPAASDSCKTSSLRKTSYQDTSVICAIECHDDEWLLDYELPPLRTLQLRLEGLSQVDPQHGRRGALQAEIDGEQQILEDSDEPVAMGVERLLRAHDPDLIVTEWGDSTLLPALMRQAQRLGFELSLNRDRAPVGHSRSRSYMSYGRILYKGSSTTLSGRLHVDLRNSFIAHQCELDGLWELVRITKLTVQYAARTSTGTGISYMQMEMAYRDGTLIPAQKAEPESPKHPDELLLADRGGLVFPPRLGFFENVAELDFASEYPNIMARFNVSPETVNCPCCPDAPRVPELGYRVCQRRRGITSRVVERLIAKRQQYKQRVKAAEAIQNSPGQFQVPAEHSASYSLRRSALKWLLVCCFGYTGYKNARFGKIEAHEAINALAREKLLVAKEVAEVQGYRVLHALVDSLYVVRLDATRKDYERLAQEIERLTNLPLALEAVYRYVVFLPSRQNAEIPVPNRFFAVTENGELKIRGLECRRHDTPPIVSHMQRQVLEILAEAHNFRSYCLKLEEARRVLDRYLDRLANGSTNVEELIIRKRLTRSPEAYRKDTATAIVARQLTRSGVKLRPGETIEYIVTDAGSKFPDDRFRAFTLWEGWHGYDVRQYQQALRDAFKPFEHFVPTPPGSPYALDSQSGHHRLGVQQLRP